MNDKLTCVVCGKGFKNGAGLASHVRIKHVNVPDDVVEPEPTKAKPTKHNNKLSTGGLNRSLKMVKMIQARCRICSPRGQGRRGWWETCEHDPYHHMEPKPGTEEFIEQADGTFVENPAPVRQFVKVPNWKQIADEPSMASGRMVQIQIERGSKFPAELGYAPICDYYNCWEENPQVHVNRVVHVEGVATRVGDYHSRDEAAIMTLRLQQTPVYIGIGEDINNRRAQLEAVNV